MKSTNEKKLTDFFGKTVKVGDKVVLLYKSYGFCKIDSAFLTEGVYLGIDRGCYQFKCKHFEVRKRNVECIKVENVKPNRHINLYAEDFDGDVWGEYCEVAGVNNDCTELTINFNSKNVKGA